MYGCFQLLHSAVSGVKGVQGMPGVAQQAVVKPKKENRDVKEKDSG